MFRLRCCIVAGVLMASVILMATIPAVAEEENFLKNPGFETVVKDKKSGEAILESWTPQTNYECKVSIVTNKENVRSGQRAVKLEILPNRKNQFNNSFYQPGNRIRVSAGEKYKISFWAKGTGTMQQCFYLYELKDRKQSYIGNAVMPSLISLPGLDIWQKYSWIYEVPEHVTYIGEPRKVGLIIFAFRLLRKGTCIFVDDCSLKEISK